MHHFSGDALETTEIIIRHVREVNDNYSGVNSTKNIKYSFIENELTTIRTYLLAIHHVTCGMLDFTL